MSSYLPETDSEDELPPGWSEKIQNGQVYYANHLNKTTQWTHPRTGKRKKVSDSLPFGWEKQTFPNGKEIFINHEEKKTSYLDPRLAFSKEITNENQDQALQNFRQRFDSSSNALQILHGHDLSGYNAIVTGASPGGIGFEMARSLARSGCSVIFACRNLESAEASIGQVRSERRNIRALPMRIDLASLNSVKLFAEDFQSQFSTLDILILNAGIFGHHHEITEDGLELTFQVNYLAHFLLLQLLKNSLMRSKIQKVIVVSSESHRFSNMTDFSAQNCLPKLSSPYNHLDAYNDSKLCCLMFALTVHKQLGLKSIAVHPGNMVSSHLSRHWWLYRLLFACVRPFSKSLQQAAAPGIFAAIAPEMAHVGGIYVNNCFPCQPSKMAMNEEARKMLWETSMTLLHERGHCC